MKCVLSLMLVLLFTAVGCLGDAADETVNLEFNGTEYREPVLAPDFTLVDQNGDELMLSELEGKVVVIAFTYTNCPDVCLAVEHNLGYVQANLGNVADDVVLISITIDPGRDNVTRLANWTATNGFNWPHLTSDNHMNIAQVWEDWNIVVDNDYLYSDHSSHGDMEMDEGENTSDTSATNDNNSNDSSNNSSMSDDNMTDHSSHNDNSTDHETDSNLAPDEYLVGHSTVTFIVDKSGHKRVAWVGSDWNADDFIADLVTLVGEAIA